MKQNKEKQITQASDLLRKLFIDFTVHNHSYHFKLIRMLPDNRQCTVDYYPTTMKWKCDATGEKGYGINHMLMVCFPVEYKAMKHAPAS